MLLTYSINNEKQMREWDQFVLSHPDGTPFHFSEWLKCIQKTYHYEPFLYVEKNNSKNIKGIFPSFHVNSFLTGSRMVSIPFSDYGGPLHFNKLQESNLLHEIIDNFKGRFKYIEIRSALQNNGRFSFHNHFKSHILELTSQPEQLKKKINKKTTCYCIRKAKKAGVTIKEENTLKGIKTFYRLNLLTRKKHGFPPQPFDFLKSIYDHFVLKGYAFLLLATYQSMVIAAGLFIKFKNTVYYKFNASDPSFLCCQSPNHLLTWCAIEQACLEGFQYFDFGRTSSDNPGLARFKESWGAKAFNLPYHYYPEIHGATSFDYKKLQYRILKQLFRHSPEIFLKKIGNRLYQHIG